MTVYEAPGKLNFSLLVSPPRGDGYHPLISLVQTVDWCDRLTVRHGEGQDALESDFEDDLILRAVSAARRLGSVPPLDIGLEKSIPVAAGLGGGSSDAAAALLATSQFGDLDASALREAATSLGADVAFFLEGGTAMMGGAGDQITETRPAEGFAVAVVSPEFGLLTKEVYARWDALEGPEGRPVPEGHLPPSLRDRMPMRNDLLPAALDLQPLLGDFMADVAAVWGTHVCLTGSGSGCFGYFTTLDEAADAASSVTHLAAEARGVELRPHGVTGQRDPLCEA